MSKKLIAVASAAALALTALVGIAPASASAPSIALVGGDASAGTAADPREVSVPFNNTIDSDASTDTAVEFTIGTSPALVIGDVITITTTGSVKVVESEVETASANFNASTLGKSSLTITKTNTTAVEVFAYTTSDTVGTVKIDIARTGLNTSNTYYIEGVAGAKHTIKNVTGVPATMTATGTAVVDFQVYDVFGNVIEADETNVSASAVRTNMGVITWNASKKVYQSTITSTGTSPFVASLDITAATVVGLPSPADSIFAVINAAGAASQITTLTAQVAALTAQLAAARTVANSVTKKKYNTLARKWNAAFPSQKVALKK
jgi:hypothetical protein